MKSSGLLVFMFVMMQSVVAQNLIERTVLGLSCQSTELPNRISEKVYSLKSKKTFNLFEFSKSNISKNKQEVSLKIGPKGLLKIKLERPTTLRIPIPVTGDQSFTLALFEVNVFEEGSLIFTPTGSQTMSPKHLYYRGIINDDHGSIVTMSIINDEIFISVNDMSGTYRITPKGKDKTSYQLTVDNSRNESGYTCGTTGEHHLGSTAQYPIIGKNTNEKGQKALSDGVRIYVVCDNKLYQDEGGTISGVEAYVALLYSEIAALYANEQINMVVSEILVYTSADPYAVNGSNTWKTLQDFGTNTPHTFNGDIASLLQGGSYSGNGCSLSGLAWVDVLCNKPANSNYGPYNVNWGLGDCSLSTTATSYNQALDVSIVAHEIGHNLGSPHTQSCCWGSNQNQAIDNCVTTTICGGSASQNCGLVPNLPTSDRKTIMSYCGNSTPFSNGFGTLPGNLIRNRVQNANCLGGGIPNCTTTNQRYDQQTIPNNTVVYASNNITIGNNVNVNSSSNVMLSAENCLVVNGTLTVGIGALLEIVTDECN